MSNKKSVRDENSPGLFSSKKKKKQIEGQFLINSPKRLNDKFEGKVDGLNINNNGYDGLIKSDKVKANIQSPNTKIIKKKTKSSLFKNLQNNVEMCLNSSDGKDKKEYNDRDNRENKENIAQNVFTPRDQSNPTNTNQTNQNNEREAKKLNKKLNNLKINLESTKKDNKDSNDVIIYKLIFNLYRIFHLKHLFSTQKRNKTTSITFLRINYKKKLTHLSIINILQDGLMKIIKMNTITIITLQIN